LAIFSLNTDVFHRISFKEPRNFANFD